MMEEWNIIKCYQTEKRSSTNANIVVLLFLEHSSVFTIFFFFGFLIKLSFMRETLKTAGKYLNKQRPKLTSLFDKLIGNRILTTQNEFVMIKVNVCLESSMVIYYPFTSLNRREECNLYL